MGGGGDGRLFEVGANSRLGAYSNKYGNYAIYRIKTFEVVIAVKKIKLPLKLNIGNTVRTSLTPW